MLKLGHSPNNAHKILPVYGISTIPLVWKHYVAARRLAEIVCSINISLVFALFLTPAVSRMYVHSSQTQIQKELCHWSIRRIQLKEGNLSLLTVERLHDNHMNLNAHVSHIKTKLMPNVLTVNIIICYFISSTLQQISGPTRVSALQSTKVGMPPPQAQTGMTIRVVW